MSDRAELPPQPETLRHKPTDEVPTVEPGEKCNGKRLGDRGNFKHYCRNPAGEGTDHEGTGRCSECGGNNEGPTTRAGKAIARMNGSTHSLRADPFKYHETLEAAGEEQFVLHVAKAIEDRIRENTGEVDFLDEVLARQMAVQFHIVAQASEHISEEGIFERIFTPDGQVEVDNRMLDHIRQYSKDLVNNLQKIGATKETQDEMDVLGVWRGKME